MNGKIFLKEIIGIKSIRYLTLLFLIALPSSCISISERMYNVPRLQKENKAENILVSYSKPDQKHLIIGELSVRYSSSYKREVAIGYLVNKAAEYGADGITLNEIRRVGDKWNMSNSKNGESTSQIEMNIYILSGSMYQYQQ